MAFSPTNSSLSNSRSSIPPPPPPPPPPPKTDKSIKPRTMRPLSVHYQGLPWLKDNNNDNNDNNKISKVDYLENNDSDSNSDEYWDRVNQIIVENKKKSRQQYTKVTKSDQTTRHFNFNMSQKNAKRTAIVALTLCSITCILMIIILILFLLNKMESIPCGDYCDYKYVSCIKLNTQILFGLNNSDWDRTAELSNSKDFNVSDIQTCLYTNTSLTLTDYGKFDDSNTSYLHNGSKWAMIEGIVLCVFVICCCISAGFYWCQKEVSCRMCRISTSGFGCNDNEVLISIGIFCLVCFVIIGLPLVILGTVMEWGVVSIQDTQSNTLYQQFDCTIYGISDIQFVNQYSNSKIFNPFAIIKYDVYVDQYNDTLIGVNVIHDLRMEDIEFLNGDYDNIYNDSFVKRFSNINDTNIDILNMFMELHSVQYCAENEETKQIILSSYGYPETNLIDPKFYNTQIIVAGIVIMCFPCICAVCLVCQGGN